MRRERHLLEDRLDREDHPRGQDHEVAREHVRPRAEGRREHDAHPDPRRRQPGESARPHPFTQEGPRQGGDQEGMDVDEDRRSPRGTVRRAPVERADLRRRDHAMTQHEPAVSGGHSRRLLDQSADQDEDREAEQESKGRHADRGQVGGGELDGNGVAAPQGATEDHRHQAGGVEPSRRHGHGRLGTEIRRNRDGLSRPSPPVSINGRRYFAFDRRAASARTASGSCLNRSLHPEQQT